MGEGIRAHTTMTNHSSYSPFATNDSILMYFLVDEASLLNLPSPSMNFDRRLPEPKPVPAEVLQRRRNASPNIFSGSEVLSN